MQITCLVSLLFVMAFSGCGVSGSSDDSNPGPAAGYDQDGSGNCSKALITDYQVLKETKQDLESELVQAPQDGNTPGTVNADSVRQTDQELGSLWASFQTKYSGVSCNAVSDQTGASFKIDAAEFNVIDDSIRDVHQRATKYLQTSSHP